MMIFIERPRSRKRVALFITTPVALGIKARSINAIERHQALRPRRCASANIGRTGQK